jgi:hypothetical protein
MRVWLRRASIFIGLPLTLVANPALPSAQGPVQRGAAIMYQPEIRTKVEALLATPDLALAADYYRIDMRFGPNLRIDAVVVGAIDSQSRARGVRVQVRDDENRARPEGTSFLDMEEVVSLSRALTPMTEMAEKWTGRDDRRSMELTFTSAGGFRLAIREFGRVQRAYLSTGLYEPSITSIDVTELVTLKLAFDQALTILNSK